MVICMSKRNNVIGVLLVISTVLLVILIPTVNIMNRENSDRLYELSLDIKTPLDYGETMFIVYDNGEFIEYTSMGKTIFRNQWNNYQYVGWCDFNWTYYEASRFTYVWYEPSTDTVIFNITPSIYDWNDPYGFGHYFIWLDQYDDKSAICMVRST